MSRCCECRTDLGALFFISGIFKFIGFSGVIGLLAVTIVIEIGGGLMLITGFRARSAAIVLAPFLIPVTAVFHGFWSADAAHLQDQLTQFLKNLAILGGMLLVIERESAAVDPLHIIGRSVA